ncbi:MAG: type III CRISPR-associated RAMP protein Csx7 [Candidatus Baldrarchaeia archaeon]
MIIKRWLSNWELYRRVVISLSLECVEPLRIGSGRRDVLTAAVDLPVIRLKDTPYIPGSSLKGVLRSTCEMIARTAGLQVCMGVGTATCANRQIGFTEKDTIEKEIKRIIGDKRPLEDLYEMLDNLCLTCKMFGTQSYSSKIFVSDAVPDGELSLGVKVGIAIDRRTGTVASGALYRVEYVEPGAVFKTQITVENLPNYALGLLCQALKEIDAGNVRIGGFKSRGFGKVRILKDSLKINAYGPTVERSDGKLILQSLDEYDEKFEYEGDLSGSGAWGFIEGLSDIWWRCVEKLKGGAGGK